MESAFLYFGGDYISLTIAKRAIGRAYVKKAYAKEPYSGIVDGEFVNLGELGMVLDNLVARVNPSKGMKLVVGVPACFCDVHVVTAKSTFKKPTKLHRSEIDVLLNGGSAIFYKIDGGARIIDATGHIANKEVEAHISHTEISSVFSLAVKHSTLSKHFQKINLVPEILCEARYLVDQHLRDRTAVLISTKMFYTTVAAVAGDEILAMQTIFMGSAHVVNDISLILNLGYEEAKAKYDSYSGDETGVYTIIRARLDDMCEQILSVINNMDKNLLTRPILLCGGHADAIKGAGKIFAHNLNVPVTILTHPLYETNNEDETAHDALVWVGLC